MSMNQNVSRRRFLTAAAGTAGGVVGFPYIISSSALGKAGGVAPSERIAMGCINPETEEIIGDPVASALLSRPYRSPWHL